MLVVIQPAFIVGYLIEKFVQALADRDDPPTFAAPGPSLVPAKGLYMLHCDFARKADQKSG